MEFDQCIQDLQGELILGVEGIKEEALREKVEKVISRNPKTKNGTHKLCVCLLAHSSLGALFQEDPHYQTISALFSGEIPYEILQEIFDRKVLLEVVFFLPIEVLSRLLLEEKISFSYLSPVIFLKARFSSHFLQIPFPPIQDPFLALLNYFLLIGDFDPSSLFHPALKDLHPPLSPESSRPSLPLILNLTSSISKDKINFGEPDAEIPLFWPFSGCPMPSNPLDYYKHLAYCIVESPDCLPSVKSELGGFPSKCENPNEIKNNVIWTKVLARVGECLEEEPPDLGNTPFFSWFFIAVSLSTSVLDPATISLIIEAFDTLPLPEKVLIITESMNIESSVLRSTDFPKQVNEFINKVSDDEDVNMKHQACTLLLSSPKEFIQLLLDESLKGLKPQLASVLVGCGLPLGFLDKKSVEDKFIDALKNCTVDSFKGVLEVVRRFIHEYQFLDISKDLLCSVVQYFESDEYGLSRRLLKAFDVLDMSVHEKDTEKIIIILLPVHEALTKLDILTNVKADILEQLLEIFHRHGKTNELTIIEPKNKNNDLLTFLRGLDTSKKEKEYDYEMEDGDIIKSLVNTLPKALPKEWALLFRNVNFIKTEEGKIRELFRAVEILLYLSQANAYVLSRAIVEISFIVTKFKSDHLFLEFVTLQLSQFLWITKRYEQVSSEFQMGIIFIFSELIESHKIDYDKLKSLAIFLDVIPSCQAKNVCLQKLKSVIAVNDFNKINNKRN